VIGWSDKDSHLIKSTRLLSLFSCIHAVFAVQTENLKKIFKQCEVDVPQITGSVLWRHLVAGSGHSAGKLDVVLLSTDDVQFSLKKGNLAIN